MRASPGARGQPDRRQGVRAPGDGGRARHRGGPDAAELPGLGPAAAGIGQGAVRGRTRRHGGRADPRRGRGLRRTDRGRLRRPAGVRGRCQRPGGARRFRARAMARQRLRHAHVDKQFDELAAQADVVVRRKIDLARQCMVPMEGKAVLAYWDHQADQLVVVSATQVPHMIRSVLAQCLTWNRVGAGGVAGRGRRLRLRRVLQQEELCVAWLAKTFKRPFRFIEDRREHLTAGANSREHHYEIGLRRPSRRCWRWTPGSPSTAAPIRSGCSPSAWSRASHRQPAGAVCVQGLSLRDQGGGHQQAGLRAVPAWRAPASVSPWS